MLANEQVIDGRGWRSGALVEQRELTQWFFKITDFNEELLGALDGLDQWPDKVRLMQRNWIGKSEGMLIRWALDETSATSGGRSEIEVYTTRPDTLVRRLVHRDCCGSSARQEGRGSTMLALAEFNEECRRAGTSVAALETAEKKGFDTGPARRPSARSGAGQLPVYVANFVLMDYGTGAIFGCPSGDQRDLDFANKYGLAGGRRWSCRRTRMQRPSRSHETAYVDDGQQRWSIHGSSMALTPAEAFRRGSEPAGEPDNRQPPARRAQGQFPPARLGHFPPALLGLPDPHDPLRRLRCGAGAQSRSCRSSSPTMSSSTVPAIRSTVTRPGGTSTARSAARLPAAKPTRWIHSSTHPGTSPASPALTGRCTDRSESRQSLAAGRSVYRRHRARHPAPALFALLYPGDESCQGISTSASRSRVMFTQGMVVHETHKGKEGWVTPAEVRLEEEGDGKRRAVELATRRGSRDRLDRENVEVEERTLSIRMISSRPTVPIRPGGSCCPRFAARTAMSSGRKPAAEGAHRFVQRVWRLVSEAADEPEELSAPVAAASDGDALAGFQGRPPDGQGWSARTSRSWRFNKAVARLYELVNLLAGSLAEDCRRRGRRGVDRRACRQATQYAACR